MENRRRTTLKVEGGIPLKNKDQFYPEDYIQDMYYHDGKRGDMLGDILATIPCLFGNVGNIVKLDDTHVSIPVVEGIVVDDKGINRPIKADAIPSYTITFDDGIYYVKYRYTEQDYGTERGKVYAQESYFWETIDSATLSITKDLPTINDICLGHIQVTGGIISGVGTLNRTAPAVFKFSNMRPDDKSILEAWLSQDVQNKLNAAGGMASRVFRFRGGNASITQTDSRRGTIIIDPIPDSESYFCKDDGSKLTRFDVDQMYPTSRKAVFRLTGSDFAVGLKPALSEAPADKIPFTFPAGLNSTTHKWTRLKCHTVGSGYDNLRIIIHDDNDTELVNQLVPIGDLAVDKWFHIEDLANIFVGGAAYHIHAFVADGTYVSQPFIYTSVAGSMQEAYFQVYYKPTAGLYPSPDVINIVNKSGIPFIPARTISDDVIINGLAPDERGEIDIIPVDFSNNGVWASWEYGTYVGVDCITGRVKLPAGYSLSEWGFAEFNFKLPMDKTNDKFTQRYAAPTVSLRDFLDKFGFLSLVDTPIEYTGHADEVVKVNASEDGLEFADMAEAYPEYVANGNIEKYDIVKLNKNNTVSKVDFTKYVGEREGYANRPDSIHLFLTATRFMHLYVILGELKAQLYDIADTGEFVKVGDEVTILTYLTNGEFSCAKIRENLVIVWNVYTATSTIYATKIVIDENDTITATVQDMGITGSSQYATNHYIEPLENGIDITNNNYAVVTYYDRAEAFFRIGVLAIPQSGSMSIAALYPLGVTESPDKIISNILMDKESGFQFSLMSKSSGGTLQFCAWIFSPPNIINKLLAYSYDSVISGKNPVNIFHCRYNNNYFVVFVDKNTSIAYYITKVMNNASCYELYNMPDVLNNLAVFERKDKIWLILSTASVINIKIIKVDYLSQINVLFSESVNSGVMDFRKCSAQVLPDRLWLNVHVATISATYSLMLYQLVDENKLMCKYVIPFIKGNGFLLFRVVSGDYLVYVYYKDIPANNNKLVAIQIYKNNIENGGVTLIYEDIIGILPGPIGAFTANFVNRNALFLGCLCNSFKDIYMCKIFIDNDCVDRNNFGLIASDVATNYLNGYFYMCSESYGIAVYKKTSGYAYVKFFAMGANNEIVPGNEIQISNNTVNSSKIAITSIDDNRFVFVYQDSSNNVIGKILTTDEFFVMSQSNEQVLFSDTISILQLISLNKNQCILNNISAYTYCINVIGETLELGDQFTTITGFVNSFAHNKFILTDANGSYIMNVAYDGTIEVSPETIPPFILLDTSVILDIYNNMYKFTNNYCYKYIKSNYLSPIFGVALEDKNAGELCKIAQFGYSKAIKYNNAIAGNTYYIGHDGSITSKYTFNKINYRLGKCEKDGKINLECIEEFKL